MIGKTLAHYEITDKLGKGGMGEVWKARDTKLGREVAIKTLPDEFARDTDRLARFEREAKLLASLNHPNIAAIYGLDEHEGIHFLVLELVEGDTLADMLARGAVVPDDALRLATQIAEALEAAHENGVIHRDLKPANIKVTPEGKVKVLDFGLAKAFTGDDSDINPANSPTLSMQATQQGMILGTAAYMSPEQAKGLPVDKRTDIFSFGCVLFEMLTGRLAFAGDMVSEILASVLAREPDFTTLRADLHPRIKALLKRCFEKEPRKRWHAAGDLRVEIEQVLEDPDGSVVGPGAGQAPARLRSIMPWAVGTLVIGALLAGSAVWLFKPAPAIEPGAVVRFRHLLGEENFSRTGRSVVDISRDGTQLAYIANAQVYLRNLNEAEARPVVGTDDNPSTPFFSPDGESLGFWSSDNELKRIPVAGGTPVTLTAANNPYGVTWNEDNTIIYGANEGVYQVSGNGGTPELIVESAEGEQIHGPQILPGGTHVLYSVSTGSAWDAAEIVVENLETAQRTTVWTGGNDARYVPTGHLVYAFENGLFALRFDLDTLSVVGGQVSMVSGALRGGTNTGTAHYAISDQGTLAQVPGAGGGGNGSRVLGFLDRDGNTDILGAPPRDYTRVRISPDESRIAVEVLADDGTTDIWIYEIQNDVLNRLTPDGGSRPIWTPDGEAVTYLNEGALWNIQSDFSGMITPLTGTDMADHMGPGSWSRDGQVLLFTAGLEIHSWERGSGSEEAAATVELIVAGLSDGSTALMPQFSPDGRWFVYMSSDSGANELYALPYPVGSSGRQTITTNVGFVPVWPRESDELVFVDGDRIMRTMEITTDPILRRSNPDQFLDLVGLGAQINGGGTPLYDVSPDGERVLVSIIEDVAAAAGDDTETGRINIVLNWFEELKDRLPLD